MTKLRRLTVIDQAEAALLDLLRQGRWKDRLPGFQVLADVVGVSVPTVGRAVRRLVQSGYLVSRGQRRSFGITNLAQDAKARPAAIRPVKRRRYLLILMPSTMDILDSWSRRFITETIRQLTREGWSCDFEALDYTGAERASKRWDKLLERHPATHLVVIKGNPVIAQWAKSKGLEVLFLGGLVGRTGVSRLGHNIWEVVSEAARRAAELGHRRMMVPLFEVPPRARTDIPAALAPHVGLSPEAVLAKGMVFHLGSQEPARRLRAFDQHFRQVQPTFILALFWRDYLQITGYLHVRGLRVPEDVSVVVCGSDPQMPYAIPKPTCYDLRIEPVLRQLHVWLRGRKPDEAAPSRSIPGSFVKGETLGPARRG